MSSYIISADVATDNLKIIITSFPYGTFKQPWITMRVLQRKHTIKRIFND